VYDNTSFHIALGAITWLKTSVVVAQMPTKKINQNEKNLNFR
jgi:hypothetical protein